VASSNFAAGAYAAVQGLGTGRAMPRVQAPTSTGDSFAGLLGQAIDGVGDAGRRADTQAITAATGKANVVDVVTAVAESETALQTMVAVRDRMISAYEEIMRMQI
jgi:flagellar hook-basal body complex protein FliE